MPALIFSLLLFIGLALPAQAMDVQLQWSAVQNPVVIGYKVYFSTESPDDLTSTPGSPLDVGDITSATLTDLPEGPVYIAVTSYSADQESSYSAIACNTWMPVLQTPSEGATNISTDVQFTWSQPANPEDYTFTVLYGEQGAPMETYNSLMPPAPFSLPSPPTALPWCLAAALTLAVAAVRFRRGRDLALCTCTALLLASCGGGNETFTSATHSEGESTASALLSPNTTYQWKVIADNGDLHVESTTGTFTTGGS